MNVNAEFSTVGQEGFFPENFLACLFPSDTLPFTLADRFVAKKNIEIKLSTLQNLVCVIKLWQFRSQCFAGRRDK